MTFNILADHILTEVITEFDISLLEFCPELKASLFRFFEWRYGVNTQEEMDAFLQRRCRTRRVARNGKLMAIQWLYIDHGMQSEKYVLTWYEERELGKLTGISYDGPMVGSLTRAA